MPDTKSFEFSRIFGEGWSAAKKLRAGGEISRVPSDAAVLNPYSSAQERARWAEGFEQAFSSPAKAYNTPGGSGWRPAKVH